MTSNSFGGAWTIEKLAVLGEYLSFYTTALRDQPRPQDPFRLVYIDAFAGTGRCGIRSGAGLQVVPGSAAIALGTLPSFAAYHFVEPKQKHLRELRSMVDASPLRDRITVHQGTAEQAIPKILTAHDWRTHRGVMFLDPFGLQCSWSTLQCVQATKALDIFFLLSVSGLFRNAAIDASGVDGSKEEAITRVFGTSEWRDAWYTREQGDMFDGPQVTREPGWSQIVDYSTARLRTLFPTVLEPRLLRAGKGPPLFALYLAVSNPGVAARQLATKAGKHILNKLR